MILPKTIEELVELFDRMPGLTRRHSQRIIFYLIRENPSYIKKLSKNLLLLKEKLSVCQLCFNLAEKVKRGKNLCEICKDKKRKENKIMIVEKIQDLEKIEKLKIFKGLYHLIGEKPIQEFNIENNIYLRYLKKRILVLLKKYKPTDIELIIALSPTKEGEIKSLYIKELFSPYKIKITKIAKGIPSGGEIEYFDSQTLKESLIKRSEF